MTDAREQGQASSAPGLRRREFIGVAIAGAVTVSGFTTGRARAASASDHIHATGRDRPLPLTVAAEVPFQVNQVALTDGNVMFVSGPRKISPTQVTPSLAKRRADGRFAAFPGTSWNDWKPGDRGVDQFVNLITCRIFWDNTVWVADWGAPMSVQSAIPSAGAQKLVGLDPDTGKIVDVFRFNDEILPPGSKLNGIRVHGNDMYITDSGLGALIYHNLSTGKTVRRLSGVPQTASTPQELAMNHPSPGYVGTPPDHSDSLQLTADGTWLYWAPPQGPWRRLKTELLRDTKISDKALATHVEVVLDDMLTVTGAGMDTLGNLYLSYTKDHRFDLAPATPHDRARRTHFPLTVSDANMSSSDSIFFSVDRRLYSADSQFSNGTAAKVPWKIWSAELPLSYRGHRLGDQVSGEPD